MATYKSFLNLHATLLWCYERVLGRALSHNQVNAGVWFIHRGRVRVEIAGNTYHAFEGQCMLVPPVERMQFFTEDAEILSVAFRIRWPDSTPLWDRDGTVRILEKEEAKGLYQASQQLIKNTNNFDYDWNIQHAQMSPKEFFEVQGHFMEWLQVFLSFETDLNTQDEISTYVQRARTILTQLRLTDHLDLEKLSADVGISLPHLNRLFRQQLKKTPRQFFHDRRVEYAQKLLTQSEVSIKEISLDLGFEHLSHFSKWCKQNLGKSPRKLRKQ